MQIVGAVSARLHEVSHRKSWQVEMDVSELRRLRELEAETSKPTARSQTSDCPDRIREAS